MCHFAVCYLQRLEGFQSYVGDRISFGHKLAYQILLYFECGLHVWLCFVSHIHLSNEEYHFIIYCLTHLASFQNYVVNHIAYLHQQSSKHNLLFYSSYYDAFYDGGGASSICDFVIFFHFR